MNDCRLKCLEYLNTGYGRCLHEKVCFTRIKNSIKKESSETKKIKELKLELAQKDNKIKELQLKLESERNKIL